MKKLVFVSVEPCKDSKFERLLASAASLPVPYVRPVWDINLKQREETLCPDTK